MDALVVNSFFKKISRSEEQICLQIFPEGTATGCAEHRTGKLDELLPWLAQKNKNGYGIFYCINRTDGKGRAAINIDKVYTFVADFDDMRRNNLAEIQNLALRPHFVVNSSPGKYHAYWLVYDCPLEQFKPIQQAIAKRLNTDPAVCDLGRVMRLPGTFHKKETPFPVRLVEARNDCPMPPPYSVEQVISGLELEFSASTALRRGEYLSVAEKNSESDEVVLTRLLCAKSAAAKLQKKATAKQLFEANESALSKFYPDTSGKNKYDASSADLALCAHLAYFTEKDQAQMDRLFRRSKLYRPKWEREDYRQRTLLRAIGLAEDVDDARPKDFPVIEVQDICLKDFKVKKGVAGGGNHVETAMYLLDTTFEGRLKKYDGHFYWWTGRRYELVGHSVVRFQIGLALSGVGRATQSNIKSQAEALFDHAEELKELDPISLKVLFKNGVFDSANHTINPHEPSNNNSRTLSVNYESVEMPQKFIQWLETIFSGSQERIQYLQEILGYLLLRGNLGIEKAILFIGPPRAGKGTLAWIIKSILGDAAAAFNLSGLYDGKQINTLRHAKVGIDAEATGPEFRHAKEVLSRFKAITSNDFLSSPVIYQSKTWNGALHCKLVIMANSVPHLHDDSGAAAKRWLPVVFDKSYLDNEDVSLKSRFVEELPCIAMWALDGLLRLMERGKFELPIISIDALHNISSESGSVQDFIDCCCCFGSDARCFDRDIYNGYVRWCIEQGQNPQSKRSIIRSIEDATRGKGVLKKKAVRIKDAVSSGFEGIDLVAHYKKGLYGSEPSCIPYSTLDRVPPPPPISH